MKGVLVQQQAMHLLLVCDFLRLVLPCLPVGAANMCTCETYLPVQEALPLHLNAHATELVWLRIV